MINVALPKGRLGNSAYALFEKAGYSAPDILSDTRKLVFATDKVRFFLVKPNDVAVYVTSGAADIGVVGSDILLEEKPDVYELIDLKIGKCRMAVAGLNNDTEKPAILKVATKYPNIAREFYDKKNGEIEIIKLHGSIELAPILGLSDVIVDIVETGATLKENNLSVKEEIFKVSARLIANKSSYKFKGNEIKSIIGGISREVNDD